LRAASAGIINLVLVQYDRRPARLVHGREITNESGRSSVKLKKNRNAAIAELSCSTRIRSVEWAEGPEIHVKIQPRRPRSTRSRMRESMSGSRQAYAAA